MALAPDQADHDRSRLETVLRWVTIAAGTLAIILILLSLAAHLLVDEEAVSARIRSSIEGSVAGSVRVEMGSVTPTLLSRSLRAEQVAIAVGVSNRSSSESTGEDVAAPSGADADSAEERRMLVTIGAVELEGIGLVRLALGNGFAIDEARFIQPHVVSYRPSKDAATADSSDHSSSTDGRPGGWEPSLAYLEIGDLAIEDGSVEALTSGREDHSRMRAEGIAVGLSGLTVDSTQTDGWLTLDDLSLAIGSYERVAPDSTSVTRMNGLRITGVGSPLRVDSVTVRPLVDLAEFLRRVDERKDRIDAALIDITVHDFDYRRFIERRDVIIRSVHADSMYLHVHVDKRLPTGMNDSPPGLPNRTMRQLEHLVRIDTVALRRGDLLYTERLPSAGSAAELWFREISGSARNITNDSSLMSEETPAVIEARTRFLGEAPAHLTIQLPLLAEDFTARYLGNVGPFPASALNEVTHPLEGVLLSGGAADSAWFDFNVAAGRADGAVVVLYQGLEIEIVGKGSSTQGLIDSFKTMIAEEKIRSSNPPEEGQPPVVGSVVYAQEPDDPFFSIFWKSLRSGLKNVLGL